MCPVYGRACAAAVEPAFVCHILIYARREPGRDALTRLQQQIAPAASKPLFDLRRASLMRFTAWRSSCFVTGTQTVNQSFEPKMSFLKKNKQIVNVEIGRIETESRVKFRRKTAILEDTRGRGQFTQEASMGWGVGGGGGRRS